MNQDKPLVGVALMIGFCVMAPLLDVCAKLAAAEIPVAEITVFRFVVQALLMMPICLYFGGKLLAPREDFVILAVRAACLLAATFCFIAAIRLMPIADALAIVFVEPFLILLMGKFFLGEQVGVRRMVACGVGFVGVLMVIQPSFAAFGPVALFPLATAVTFAAYLLVTRKLSGRMSPVSMQYHTAVFGAVMAIALVGLAQWMPFRPASFDLVMPQGVFWLLLFGVGAFASISHMMVTVALRYAPSATLAPLHYLELISAGFFGYIVFGDFPNNLALWGIGIILLAGLYCIYRERVTSKEMSRAQA